MAQLRRFAAVYDLHWGYERKGGHAHALHDERAWETTLKFLSDFKPHDFIFGGDILDCGAISHHNKGKPRKTEGFRLLKHAEECTEKVIKPVERILGSTGVKHYIIGNHEDWIQDLLDADPALEGLVDIRKLLHLGKQKWNVIEQGHGVVYGKQYFLHGDTIYGGEHIAKAGVLNYEKNVRFGHHHTYQVYTKTSPVENEVARTGVAVPCLCTKDVGYMERKPNKWVQGFLYGWMVPGGAFQETVAVIIKGQLVAEGKVYKS